MEFAEKIDFKEQFLVTFFLDKKHEKEESSAILKWIKGFQFKLIYKKHIRIILIILSLITVVLLVFGFLMPIYWYYAVCVMVLNILINFRQKRTINYIHEHSSKQEKLFKKYSILIHLIKNEVFNNSYALGLQKKSVSYTHLTLPTIYSV